MSAKLMRAILIQALDDATSKPSDAIREVEIIKARRWLTRQNPWFAEVCEYIDLDPARARTKFKAYINEFERTGDRPALVFEEMAQEAPAASVDGDLIASIKAKREVRRRGGGRRGREGVMLQHDGKCMSVAAWADHLGLSYGAVRNRLISGLPLDQVLRSDKARASGKLTIILHGSTLTLGEVSRQTGIKYATIFSRYKKGLSPEMIIAPASHNAEARG